MNELALTTHNFQHDVKRLIDLMGAIVGLILFGPVLVLIMVLIEIDAPGQVFYRQERIGWGGSSFDMLKFRTMREYAQEALEHHLRTDLKSRTEYAKYQKLADDPRLTRVGRFLRRSSLDELPQLWNVLKGEMSLVGPRPFLPEQMRLYGPACRYYQMVRPGLTGLWQISGRNCLSFEERVILDEKYVKEWSIWLDLAILLRTPWVVFCRKGAF